jgi:thiol-disulfide isomerase/thioredoxin
MSRRGLLAFAVLFIASAAIAEQQVAPEVERLEQQARAFLASGKYEDAAKTFNKADNVAHGQCADCQFGLAVAYARRGDLKNALRACDRGLSVAQTAEIKAEIHHLKGNIFGAFTERDKSAPQEQLTEYRAAVANDAANPRYRYALGVALLRASVDNEGVEQLNRFLELAPNDPKADSARQMIADHRRAQFEFAPAFEAATIDGQRISLGQFGSRIVVMDFWATWCPPCRESVPDIRELSRKYRDRVVVISVSADNDQNTWRQFVQKKKMDWLQVYDGDGTIRNLFGVHEFPTYLVIDGGGAIQQRIVGEDPQQTIVARLKQKLAAMPELATVATANQK